MMTEQERIQALWRDSLAKLDERIDNLMAATLPARRVDPRRYCYLAAGQVEIGFAFVETFSGEWRIGSVSLNLEPGATLKALTAALAQCGANGVVISTPAPEDMNGFDRACTLAAWDWAGGRGLDIFATDRNAARDAEHDALDAGWCRLASPAAAYPAEKWAFNLAQVTAFSLSDASRNAGLAADFVPADGQAIRKDGDPSRYHKRADLWRHHASQLRAAEAIREARAALARSNGEAPGAAHAYGPHSAATLAKLIERQRLADTLGDADPAGRA